MLVSIGLVVTELCCHKINMNAKEKHIIQRILKWHNIYHDHESWYQIRPNKARNMKQSTSWLFQLTCTILALFVGYRYSSICFNVSSGYFYTTTFLLGTLGVCAFIVSVQIHCWHFIFLQLQLAEQKKEVLHFLGPLGWIVSSFPSFHAKILGNLKPGRFRSIYKRCLTL